MLNARSRRRRYPRIIRRAVYLSSGVFIKRATPQSTRVRLALHTMMRAVSQQRPIFDNASVVFWRSESRASNSASRRKLLRASCARLQSQHRCATNLQSPSADDSTRALTWVTVFSPATGHVPALTSCLGTLQFSPARSAIVNGQNGAPSAWYEAGRRAVKAQ